MSELSQISPFEEFASVSKIIGALAVQALESGVQQSYTTELDSELGQEVLRSIGCTSSRKAISDYFRSKIGLLIYWGTSPRSEDKPAEIIHLLVARKERALDFHSVLRGQGLVESSLSNGLRLTSSQILEQIAERCPNALRILRELVSQVKTEGDAGVKEAIIESYTKEFYRLCAADLPRQTLESYFRVSISLEWPCRVIVTDSKCVS